MNSAYLTHLGTMFAIQLILVGSFSFLFGGVGVPNLAHVSSVAVGAYTSALLSLYFGWPFGITLSAAAVLGAISGLLLAVLLRRVRGDYLALLALEVHFLTTTILLNWPSVTRGALGLPGIPRPAGLATPLAYLVLTGAIAITVIAVYYAVLRSPYGRVMAAVRDDETAAFVFGKRAPNVRMTAFLFASAGAAVGGALLAHYIQFIDPLTFSIHLLALALAGAIIGGVGSVPGMIAGAAMIVVVPELLRRTAAGNPDIAGALRQLAFAGLILLILLFRPRGLFG
ncbi:MAG: branched-chain amino acid ABC transporter permease, partial [bacterium]|nr:branched-chain amino acid ABC transporter permease [bacterium]